MADKRFPIDLNEKTTFVGDDQLICANSEDSDALVNLKLKTFRKNRTSAKTGIDTLTLEEDFITANGTFTLTLPTIASASGHEYIIKNIGSGTVTIDGNGSENIDGAATYVMNVQYEWVILKAGSSEWHVIG